MQDAETVHVFHGREYICLDCSRLQKTDTRALSKALSTARTAATHQAQLKAASEVWQLAVQYSAYAQAPLYHKLYGSSARPTQPLQGYAELCARQYPGEYSKFAAGVNLLCTVTELTAVVYRDSRAPAAAKSFAEACVRAVATSLQPMLARMMSSADADTLVQYIATPAAPHDAALWQQYLTNMQNTSANLSATASSTSNTAAAAAAGSTAVGGATTAAATAAGIGSTTSSAGAVAAAASVSHKRSELQEQADIFKKRWETKYSAKVQHKAALKQQLQDKVNANAAVIAAKQQEYTQLEQQEREKYVALLHQLEQEEAVEEQRVQQLARR
jgi:hypothetical protein